MKSHRNEEALPAAAGEGFFAYRAGAAYITLAVAVLHGDRVFSQRGGAVEPALKGELDPDIAAMKADPVHSADYLETWNPKFDKLR